MADAIERIDPAKAAEMVALATWADAKAEG
jgi:hypothetical protein